MSMTAKEYSETIETAFPPLSGAAFSSACESAFQSGQSVLQVYEGSLFRVYSDGRREFIKSVQSPVSVEPGKIIRIGS